MIDGTPIPGPIAIDGVSVQRMGYERTGRATLNTVTVTLLVGAVDIDDDAVGQVDVLLSRSSKLD